MGGVRKLTDCTKLFGLRLRSLREARGLTREQLAEMSNGLTEASIGRWETGKQSVKMSNIGQLAELLKVPPHYFLLPDAEAERMLYRTDRKTADEDTIEYKLHQKEIQLGRLEAELRNKTQTIEIYKEHLNAKDTEVANLRKRLTGNESNSLTEHSKQMLQLSARLVEIVVGSMLTEDEP